VTSQLHDAAARGDTEAGLSPAGRRADINEANEQGDTALLLACRGGVLELATRLKDAWADVSVANKQGDTALLAAVTVGNLRVGRAARELGRRRQGAAAGWCRTHSASHPLEEPRLYQLCPAPQPRAHRIAEHFRRLGAGVRVFAQHPAMASRWCVPPDTRARDRGPATASRGGCWQARRHARLAPPAQGTYTGHGKMAGSARGGAACRARSRRICADETDGSGEGICCLIECITPSSATGEYGCLDNAKAFPCS